ncbi:hypothetical protein GQ43DRAFT_302885 [Delitschia confertaspora ATCC 74209]|uniref:ABM domain-containing protein n=1 Tax=Delitschia confertaspora ATCC 74209 TaxID=1513339 RepID=A0A9P4JNE3_9PLEO|nr:hypothetical protein GQ43DRAFT_302885 [Delitschia confertaspora ATCC 74209]
MAVTELALLHIVPPLTASDASLRSKLKHAKTLMESFTGRQFYYLQQIEDPSYIYVLGEWDSVQQHMEGFIPSSDNQGVLESLKGQLEVKWLLHMIAPHSSLPVPRPLPVDRDATAKELKYKGKYNVSPKLWSIERYFIKPGEKQKFEETFEENKHHLQEYVTEGTIGGGWRADAEEGKEEFVLFSPWKSVEAHESFVTTPAHEKYAALRGSLEGVDVRHAELLFL